MCSICEQLTKEVENLIKLRVVGEVGHEKGEHISKISAIKEGNGKNCLVLNFKWVKKYVKNYPKVKLPQIHDLCKTLPPNAKMIVVDLESVFYCKEIAPDMKKYFRFELKGQVYEYQVLPCGFGPGIHVVNELLDSLFGYLRSQGCYSFRGRNPHVLIQLARFSHLEMSIKLFGRSSKLVLISICQILFSNLVRLWSILVFRLVVKITTSLCLKQILPN